jgi:hypothetical protein
MDGASLRLFRWGFGLLAAVSALRFVVKGWVAELYLDPSFHFAWFDWATVPSAPVLYGLFAAQVIGGLGTAFCDRYRPWLATWLGCFIYVELLDKALYLNHYVLMSLLGIGLLIAPFRRDGRAASWHVWLLRIQVALVYLWAGLCKVNGDWLLRAEPLQTWLQARSDLPVVGPVLASDVTAFAMSWGGCAYDLSIAALLMWPRTRLLGIVLVVVFHTTLGLLFPIGVFPWLMALAVSLFFRPSWPREWLGGRFVPNAQLQVWAGWKTAIWCGVVAIMCLFPARFLLYNADVNWDEQGYRLSWRVLLTEKTGFVEYNVVHADGRAERIVPRRELTPIQVAQLVGKPDLIAHYGRFLGQRFPDSAVFVDSFVSLNRSPSQRFISDQADLSRPVSELQDGWILPRKPLP